MATEFWSPQVGVDGGSLLEGRRAPRGRPGWSPSVLALLWIGLQAACATGHRSEGALVDVAGHRGSLGGTRAKAAARPERSGEKPGLEDAGANEREAVERGVVRATGARGAPGRRWRPRRSGGELEEKGIGWPDGVGDGRPFEVPMALDYFQGFLVQAGVPITAVPGDGRTLSTQQALELLPHLLATPVTLDNFGPRRMAAHLLLEVATGGALVTRDELHDRMRRFSELLVLRPDGYLVKVASGVAVQRAGQVALAEDGTLRAGRLEVGPFYVIGGGRLFPVNQRLEVPMGTPPAGLYEPDDNPGLAVAEGALLAVVDMVEGLYRLAFRTDETLEGLAQLPGAVRQLYENSPQLWEEFRHKPHAEKVRTLSRLATGVVLTVGTSGAGAAKAASWGGKLGSVTVPLLSLSGDGLLAVRLVAVPSGSVVAVAGNALSATYVLYMARTGVRGGGGGGWPPTGGPGQWVEDTSSMSEQSRDYQAQVTGAPRGWCYKVCRNGECVEYDGFDPSEGILIEGKARGYEQWFDEELSPTHAFYGGLKGMLQQAARQFRVAAGQRLRWHVAEPRMVAVLRKYFDEAGLHGIEVVYTHPVN